MEYDDFWEWYEDHFPHTKTELFEQLFCLPQTIVPQATETKVKRERPHPIVLFGSIVEWLAHKTDTFVI